MTKWWHKFGKEHPEAFGKIRKPEDKALYLFKSDVESFNHDVIVAICKHLKIDIQDIYRKYSKTTRQQYKEHGYDYDKYLEGS